MAPSLLRRIASDFDDSNFAGWSSRPPGTFLRWKRSMRRRATSKKAGSIRITGTAGSGAGAIAGKAEKTRKRCFRLAYPQPIQSEISA
jgi:hypothetical protein